MVATSYPHLGVDKRGRPVVQGTRLRVMQIAEMHLAHDWEARDIHGQHPDIALPAIHSALAYYYDHKEEMDGQMRETLAEVEQIRASLPAQPTRAELISRIEVKRGRSE